MLYIKTQSSKKDKQAFLRSMRLDPLTAPLLKQKPKDNCIASIFDNNVLCGCALVCGGAAPMYILCCFTSPEYCTEHYDEQLKAAIANAWPKILLNQINDTSREDLLLYDVHYLKSSRS